VHGAAAIYNGSRPSTIDHRPSTIDHRPSTIKQRDLKISSGESEKLDALADDLGGKA
jgi:hypothetical protein